MLVKLVDFGLVILIWMTQLVVYPSFTYFAEQDLVSWHQKYTGMISVIVMPLMLAQVVLHGYNLWGEFNWLELIICLLIAGAWAHTFLIAVPLHNKIGSEQHVLVAADQLVRVNWVRTFIWSAVFVLTMIRSSKTL